jgi:hypothetical protein
MQALGYTSEEIALQTLLLNQDKQRVEAAEQLRQIEAERKAKLAEVDTNANAAMQAAQAAGPISATDKGKLDKDREDAVAKVNAKYDEQKTKQEALRSIAEEKLELEKSTAKALADQAKESKKVGQFSSALLGAFKNTGLEKQAKALGDFLNVSTKGKQKLANLDAAEAKRKKEMLALETQGGKALENLNEAQLDQYFKLSEAGVEGAKERKMAELDAVGESAAAFKGMFSEKTAAYKVLNAIEKGMHVAKLAMMAAEVAASIASVGPTVAAEGTKSAAKGVGAILSALNAPWPVNFVAGAAMAAIVASLLGGGGKKVNAPAGMSAKDRQETQGTGYSWVNGEKVENGNGVFGDASAK